MKALVIEDDEPTRTFFVDALNDAGYETVGAGSSDEARQTFEGDKFGLITLDLGLPDGDGLDFCKWLRGRPNGNDAYIIVITGRTEPEDITAVLEAGASDYIAKPLSLPALLVRLALAADKIRANEAHKALVAEAPPVGHQPGEEPEVPDHHDIEEAYRALFALCDEGVLIFGRDGFIDQANPAAEKLLQAGAGSLVGKAIKAFIPGIGSALDPGAGRREVQAINAAGEQVAIKYRTRTIGGPRGETTLLLFAKS